MLLIKSEKEVEVFTNKDMFLQCQWLNWDYLHPKWWGMGGGGLGQLKSLEKDLPGLKYFDFWKGITKLGGITLVVTTFL